jgi:uncharacterized OB-fold protein
MTRIADQSASGVRSYPPRVSKFTQPFWEALRRNDWITTTCKQCGRQSFPPKSVCPACWSVDVEWRDLSSQGTLYSWTRIHSAPTAFQHEAPYAVCIVDLDSGIRMACRLVDGPDGEHQTGSRVEIISVHYEDGALFAARPVAR